MKARIRFSDYFLLAFRNILHQRSRSLLAILAIVIGTTSVTIMLTLVMGTKTFYYDQFRASGKLEQVIVNSQTGLNFEQAQQAVDCPNCVKLSDSLANKIKSYQHVTSLSRTADVNIFELVSYGHKKLLISNAQSYDPTGVIKHVFLAGGDFKKGDGVGKVIVGQDYADEWGYMNNYQKLIGKQIDLITISSFTGEGATLPDPLAQFKKCLSGCQVSEIATQQATTLKATVVGVESDVSNGILVPLAWAQGLLTGQRYEITKPDQTAYSQAYTIWTAQGQHGPEPMPKFTLVKDDQLATNGYSTFVVKVDNSNNADAVAARIQKLGVGASTARSYIQDQLNIFNIISFILAGIGSISLVVAAIGIINTMVMATLERTREIGVMRAVGAKRSTVRLLFTLEASLLGFLGGVFGIIVGYGFIQIANIFINIQLSANGVPNRNIILLPMWLALVLIASTAIIGMLAGLYPAHRAATLDPVEALRHE